MLILKTSLLKGHCQYNEKIKTQIECKYSHYIYLAKKNKKQKLVQIKGKTYKSLQGPKQTTLPQTQDMNRHFTKEDRMQGQYES